MITDYDKIPLLGDIPILGNLFRSKELRQNRSELLVLVTPQLVYPQDESPAVPTGEPETWDWERHLDGPAPKPGEEGRQHELKPSDDVDEAQADDAEMTDGAGR